jgi:hypothetical protein
MGRLPCPRREEPGIRVLCWLEVSLYKEGDDRFSEMAEHIGPEHKALLAELTQKGSDLARGPRADEGIAEPAPRRGRW